MRRQFHRIRDFLLPIIDFFYPPFRKVMNIQTFRYAAAGSGNVLLGFIIYVITFRLILDEKNLHLGFFAFKGHVAALFVSFCVTFPIGFFMSKYVVFSDSRLRGKIQLLRYFVICLFNLALNYILLKIFVERFHIDPVPAQIITTCIVIVFSYLAQRHFSFKASAVNDDLID